MYLTTKGLVLRVTNYSDSDALLTVLTHTHGKLTVKARGLRRKNSPLAAPCQLLTYADFTLFDYRGRYTINEAHLVESFGALRKDLDKLALGTYFAQVAEVICQEDVPNPELLSLVLNALYALTKSDVPVLKIKAAFELRAACLAGYLPDLSECTICGNQYPGRFNISEGTLECEHCAFTEPNGIRMPLTNGALDAMRYICNCDAKRLLSFTVNGDSISCLADVAESYLATQLERGFSTLDFYKSLTY